MKPFKAAKANKVNLVASAETVSASTRAQRRAGLRGLYVVTDARAPGGHVAMARAALQGGAKIIQLRDKTANTRELLAMAHKIRQLTRDADALFFINDRVDVAVAAEADGVHLGPDDLPLEIARPIIGTEMLLGVSCADETEAREAQNGGADYIGAGAVFGTQTKLDAGAAIGVDALRAIVRATTLPVAGIGGVTRENLRAIIETGARMACVVSAIASAPDELGMQAATRKLVEVANGYALLYGEVQTTLDAAALRELLLRHGLSARVEEPKARKSPHILRVYSGDALLTLEKNSAAEYAISGEAPTVFALSAGAQTVSDALRVLNLRHVFEVVAPSSDELAAHFEFD